MRHSMDMAKDGQKAPKCEGRGRHGRWWGRRGVHMCSGGGGGRAGLAVWEAVVVAAWRWCACVMDILGC